MTRVQRDTVSYVSFLCKLSAIQFEKLRAKSPQLVKQPRASKNDSFLKSNTGLLLGAITTKLKTPTHQEHQSNIYIFAFLKHKLAKWFPEGIKLFPNEATLIRY